MPKTKFQNVIFTLLMAFAMVYAMICYNIAINRGGMTNQVFMLAFHEVIIMWPVAFVLEMFVVERLAKMLAFRLVSPDDKPIFILLAISSMIVCLMCPMMSLVATILFQNPGKEIIALWFQPTVLADLFCRTAGAPDFPYSIPREISYAGAIGEPHPADNNHPDTFQ